jgi:hypothetical protein
MKEGSEFVSLPRENTLLGRGGLKLAQVGY